MTKNWTDLLEWSDQCDPALLVEVLKFSAVHDLHWSIAHHDDLRGYTVILEDYEDWILATLYNEPDLGIALKKAMLQFAEGDGDE